MMGSGQRRSFSTSIVYDQVIQAPHQLLVVFDTETNHTIAINSNAQLQTATAASSQSNGSDDGNESEVDYLYMQTLSPQNSGQNSPSETSIMSMDVEDEDSIDYQPMRDGGGLLRLYRDTVKNMNRRVPTVPEEEDLDLDTIRLIENDAYKAMSQNIKRYENIVPGNTEETAISYCQTNHTGNSKLNHSQKIGPPSSKHKQTYTHDYDKMAMEILQKERKAEKGNGEWACNLLFCF